MEIRNTTENDFERVMQIYAYARSFMAEHGNPNQWGPTNWPPEELIHQDIRQGNSYVCLNENGEVIGTFFFTQGEDIEPTYRQITDGAWLDDSPYGVVHRIASDGSQRGVGVFCLDWAYAQCGHLRIDTHGDNVVMQNMVKKAGFVHCGTIYVQEDSYPRLAFEKSKITEAMELKRMPYDLTVCKISDADAFDKAEGFYFLSQTDEELSLVCRTQATPANTLEREDGWKAFRIQGVLDFSLVGILAKVSGILAESGIGIFAVSTFNTDYILTKAESFEKALAVLGEAGYRVID